MSGLWLNPSRLLTPGDRRWPYWTPLARRSSAWRSLARLHVSSLPTIVTVAGCLLIAGCGGEPASVRPVVERVAHAQALTNDTYQVQLRYSVTTSGGPCLNKDWFRTSTSYDTNWLYVKAIDGVWTADQLILTSDPDKMEWPYAITNIRGRVAFTNATMTVQLDRARYPDGEHLAGYTPYELNAMYQIIVDPSPNQHLQPTPR